MVQGVGPRVQGLGVREEEEATKPDEAAVAMKR